MLILKRRAGEQVCIGNDIVITIASVKGGDVRIGIEAPESVPVHRREIFERILRERMAEKEAG